MYLNVHPSTERKIWKLGNPFKLFPGVRLVFKARENAILYTPEKRAEALNLKARLEGMGIRCKMILI